MPKENENAKSEKAKKARSWDSWKGGATKLNRNPGVVYHQDIISGVKGEGREGVAICPPQRCFKGIY